MKPSPRLVAACRFEQVYRAVQMNHRQVQPADADTSRFRWPFPPSRFHNWIHALEHSLMLKSDTTLGFLGIASEVMCFSKCDEGIDQENHLSVRR